MRLKLLTLLAAMAACFAATAADARPTSSGDTGYETTRSKATGKRSKASRAVARKASARTSERRRARVARAGSRGSYIRTARADSDGDTYASSARHSVGPRPRAWCGWWMRTQRGGGPEFNVAWNWRKYGSPTSPQVGAVVVWRHHVGEIVGQASNGQWLVRSGNDGRAVRTRARSVAGAIFRI